MAKIDEALEALGKNVRDLIEDSDKNLPAIEKLTGISYNTLKKYKTSTTNMSVEKLLQICIGFDKTPNELCGYTKGEYVNIDGLTKEQKKEVREYIAAKKRKLSK